jgi:hypothetical protein
MDDSVRALALDRDALDQSVEDDQVHRGPVVPDPEVTGVSRCDA